MFEIPDDDENFFSDIPLDDITNKKLLEHEPAISRPQLRVPETSCTGNAVKQLCSGNDRRSREFQTSPGKPADANYVCERISSTNTASEFRVTPGISNTSGNTNLCQRGSMPTVPAVTIPSALTSSEQTSTSGANYHSTDDYITPKRKRKFPGPAGLLPHRGQEKSIDMQAVNSSVRTPQPSTPVQEGTDPNPPSSQSSDDVFGDIPWQALQTDLGEDGVKLMKKFSIGCTLLKAGKKQLYQGKAVLLCGVIDFIESHGSEASVTIRDRSGKMQGTVHRDLLKEYEAELQIGTVLVLKQVSIISLSNRNHYLNITPSNLVCLYHSKMDKLTRLKFHGSQESLRSVLSALEKKAASRRSMNSSSTSGSGTGSSRQSISGSSTGTPILPGSLPNTPVLNQGLSRPGTPYSSHSQSRLMTPADVRDVSVIRSDSVPTTPFNVGNSNTMQHDNIGQNCVTSGRLSSLLLNKQLPHSGNRLANCETPNLGNASGALKSLNNSETCDKINSINQRLPSDNTKTAVTSSVSKQQSWNFKHKSFPVTPGTNSPVPFSNNQTGMSGRSCQLSGSMTEQNPGSTNTGRTSTSKWSFKTRVSPGSSSTPSVPQKHSPAQNTKSSEKKGPNSLSAEDMWDDDLNDELLSQLSDEMT